MKKKVLITGVGGFLGGSLWRYLKEKQPAFKIFGLDTKVPCSHRRIYRCNLLNRKKLTEIISVLKPDYIFHCAGGRATNIKQLYTANVLTTQALFAAAASIKGYRPRIVIPGSAAEYGKPNPQVKSIRENTYPRPLSQYGCVKYMQTALSLLYAHNGFDIVIARMFNIVGYGTPPDFSIGKFAREIACIEKRRKSSVIRTKSLDGKRDFLDINDVCSALVAIARKGKAAEVYNACSAKSYSIRDLLQKLLRYTTIKNIAVRENKSANEPSFNSIGSNTKIVKATGWRQRISIDRSLKNTLNYYREIV